MNIYLTLRFFHIIGAIMLIGGVLARQLVRSRLRKTTERTAFRELFHAAELIDRRLVIPGSILVLLAGIALAWVTGAPILGFLQGAEQNWLLLSILLIIFGMLLVIKLFLPLRRKVETWLEQSGEVETVPAELLQALNDRRLQIAYQLEFISFLLVALLMVYKPF